MDLEKLESRLDSIDKTLVKQQVILEEHVKRTNILEERFEPIEKYKNELIGIVKFFKFLGIIAVLIECIYQLTHWYS